MSIATFERIRSAAAGAYTELVGHRTDAVNPLWDVTAADLRDWTIRWPRQYQWAAASDWVDVLRDGFRKYSNFKRVDSIPQPYKGTVVFEIDRRGERRKVAIGYSDYRPIDDNCGAEVDLYFKMQFDAAGYRMPHVVPGGYVPCGRRLYRSLDNVRSLRDRRDYLTDVSGRFGTAYAREIREAATSLLKEQQSFAFEGGMGSLPYKDYLKEIARSRICIDLPGLGDLCFRLVDYLAVGTCVIAYPHKSLLHVPLVDRQDIVYCAPDLSDLVELCEYYLSHDDERENIATNARRYFDLNLHSDNLVRYYLSTCLNRLG